MDEALSQPRVFAAAITPMLQGEGAAIDPDGIAAVTEFLVASGVDGMLVLGTTGEGLLLDGVERRRALETFMSAASHRFEVIAHCGAQSTCETVELSAHAAELGADAIAVIAPPYFALDEAELLAHFAAAAKSCEPAPFFVYEYAARSGYRVPLAVVTRLREVAPNLAGLKVSDSPWAAVAPYRLPGLRLYVGSEEVIAERHLHDVAGAVSGLATALPELVIKAVRTGDPLALERLRTASIQLRGFPFHATMKAILGRRGVRLNEMVRRPLRSLTDAERESLRELIVEWMSLPTPEQSPA